MSVAAAIVRIVLHTLRVRLDWIGVGTEFSADETQASILRDTRFGREFAILLQPEEVTPEAQRLLRRMQRNSMLNREGAAHHRLRTPFHKAFTPRMISNLSRENSTDCG
jgi:hypothetical protein